MTSKFGPDLELPADLRALAEKNMAQARQAFDTLFDTARNAVGESEERLEEVRSSVKDLRQKTLGLVEDNVNASFGFLDQLVQARTPQDVLTLQAEFLKKQMEAVANQAASLGSDARSLGESTVRSLDEQTRALAERVQALSSAATQQAKQAAEDFQSAALRAAKEAADKVTPASGGGQ